MRSVLDTILKYHSPKALCEELARHTQDILVFSITKKNPSPPRKFLCKVSKGSNVKKIIVEKNEREEPEAGKPGSREVERIGLRHGALTPGQCA